MSGGKRPGGRRLPGVRESVVMVLAFGLLALRGLGGGTSASLNAQDGNAADTWATFSVVPPGTISPTQSGASNVSVSWGASSNASSYLVQGASAGKTASCASVTWGTLAAANATTSYTDIGRVTVSTQGSYFCYKVTSNDPSGWTSVNNPTTAFSLGLWIVSWSWTNAVSTLTADCGSTGYGATWGLNGALDCGDTITVTFSAPVDQTLFTTTNSWVCVVKSSNHYSVILGDTNTTGCSTTDTYTLGLISASGNNNLGTTARFPLYAVSWSGNQATLTLGSSGTQVSESSPITWALTPSSSLAAPTGGQGQVGCVVPACQASYAASS